MIANWSEGFSKISAAEPFQHPETFFLGANSTQSEIQADLHQIAVHTQGAFGARRPSAVELVLAMYGPPQDCKGKVGEKTSLRKCIRPLVGD